MSIGQCTIHYIHITCSILHIYTTSLRGVTVQPRYIEYYRLHTILFSEIKTNNLFTGGLDKIENRK
jgi:hypothetical protein